MADSESVSSDYPVSVMGNSRVCLFFLILGNDSDSQDHLLFQPYTVTEDSYTLAVSGPYGLVASAP